MRQKISEEESALAMNKLPVLEKIGANYMKVGASTPTLEVCHTGGWQKAYRGKVVKGRKLSENGESKVCVRACVRACMCVWCAEST